MTNWPTRAIAKFRTCSACFTVAKSCSDALGSARFENARRAQDDLRGVQNNRKRYDGYLGGTLDPEIWGAIEASRKKLRDAINARRRVQGALGGLRSNQAGAGRDQTRSFRFIITLEEVRRRTVLSCAAGFQQHALQVCARFLRAADERAKPNGERFPEFRDSIAESLELDLFSTEPVHDDFEMLR